MSCGRFRRCQRLLSAADYSRVFNKAIRSRDRYFTVLRSPNDAGRARLGLAVSRKTDKRAVVRNRLKRQVRESFRVRSLPCGDYVVISHPTAASASAPEIRQSLARHWKKLGGAGADGPREPATHSADDS